MELFIKNGQISRADEIVVCQNGINFYNPSEKQILADGWEEYIPERKEPTSEELLENAKERKKKEIYEYDHSDEINLFYFHGQGMWLSREDRITIKDRFVREQNKGVEVSNLFANGQRIEVSPQLGIALVDAVAEYADKCFDRTQIHYANVDQLTSVDEVEAYDFKVGYPEKLNF